MTSPHYGFRPSKDVIRRMFVDCLTHLSPIAPVNSYRYVGLGALEFFDFELVHRNLSIQDLTSIEWATNEERYAANKPYQSIRMLHGTSTHALGRMKWDDLSIVWLDYESTFNSTVLADITYLSARLAPGSFLAVTLNCEPGKLAGRRDRLAQIVEDHRVPAHATDATLGAWGWAAAQQKILFSTLRSQLQKRPDAASWKQLLNFNYQDGARMQMIGGLIASPSLEKTIKACDFEHLGYTRPGPDPMVIEVPYLTTHEQSILRRKLPRKARQRLHLPGLSTDELKRYEAVYQWIEA